MNSFSEFTEPSRMVIQVCIVQGQQMTARPMPTPVWMDFPFASDWCSGFVQSNQTWRSCEPAHWLCLFPSVTFFLGQHDFDLADALDHPGA